MKTRLQKALPWALPILVLVFVLSGCGKDNKVHALDQSAQQVAGKALQAKTQAQRANGSTDGNLLDPKAFAARCTSGGGDIESGGTICATAVPLLASDLNPSEVGVTQPILNDVPQDSYLVIATGNATPDVADVRLDGAHFMNAGERKLSQQGNLSFTAISKSNATLSVSVYKCQNNRVGASGALDPVDCNTDILKGHK